MITLACHNPTDKEIAIAKSVGVTLEPIPEYNDFTVTPEVIGPYEGVVARHPAAALRLQPFYVIGVFEYVHVLSDSRHIGVAPVGLHLFGGEIA